MEKLGFANVAGGHGRFGDGKTQVGSLAMLGQTIGILKSLGAHVTGVQVELTVVLEVGVNLSLGTANELTRTAPGSLLQHKRYKVGIEQVVHKFGEGVNESRFTDTERLIVTRLHLGLHTLELVVHLDIGGYFERSSLDKGLDFLEVCPFPLGRSLHVAGGAGDGGGLTSLSQTR